MQHEHEKTAVPEYLCRLCKTEKAFGHRYPKGETLRDKLDKCLTCAIEERNKIYLELEKALTDEQKVLFEQFTKASQMVTFISITP